ncbi:MAG: hypothetical protein ABEJ67_04200 [Halanaeroarchaeum sp.]
MRRRDFIAAAGTVGVGALAGCSGAIGAVAAPVVPRDRLDRGGWELQQESQETVFKQSFGPVTVVAKAHSLTYSDVALRRAVAQKTLGAVDAQMALFSATRIQFDPDLTGLPVGVVDRTEEAARQQFVQRMRKAGLRNVTREKTGTLEVDTGESARLTSYTAEFPFDGVSFPVTEDQTVTISGAPLTVAGDLAVWRHGGSVLVAGGAYPAENFAKTTTEELSSAITVTVDIDLGLTPDSYRQEVRGLMTAVR